jgi:pyrroloquinoline quinone (PQQ) biosynthesis protein C
VIFSCDQSEVLLKERAIVRKPPDFVDELVKELLAHPVNRNAFFQGFKDQRLSRFQLQQWLRQYHYFCKNFVKLLEGLLYRTPIDALEMRVELAKTLYSELGSGRTDHAHIRLLERFGQALGVSASHLCAVVPIPEVTSYLSILHHLFLESDYLVALGAELAVEVTAAAEFHYFYPGLLQYRDFSDHDLVFFELHLEAEDDHSAWLSDAVRKTARSKADLEQVAAGARTTADAWHAFWNGLYQAIFAKALEAV